MNRIFARLFIEEPKEWKAVVALVLIVLIVGVIGTLLIAVSAN